jgi:predicted phage terminase large subunit-like protein
MYAAGIGGTITGRGADVLIIGDYLKNREEAESELMRDKVWDSFQSDLMTRLAPVHAVIIVANRWHVDDLCGRIEAKNNQKSEQYDPDFPVFSIIRFPAQKQMTGEWLFPERFSDEWYRAERAVMGEYAWAAQALQDPQPRQGNLLRIDNVKIAHELPDGLYWQWGWDIASTEKERMKPDPDYTVGTLAAFHDDTLYVADVRRGRWGAVERDRRIVQAALTSEASRVNIEAVGGYKDAALRIKGELSGRAVVSAITWKAGQDKVARVAHFEPLFEAGKIVLRQADWNAPWLAEFGAFPAGKHDDQVDSLVVAARDLVMRRGRSRLSA